MPAKSELRIEDAGKAIVDELLIDNNLQEDDEQAEVQVARSILAALSRLQSSLQQATPAQQHDITSIRAAASELIRMHNRV